MCAVVVALSMPTINGCIRTLGLTPRDAETDSRTAFNALQSSSALWAWRSAAAPWFRKIHWSFAQPPYVSASMARNTSSVSAKNQSAMQPMSMSFLMHSLQRKGKSNFFPLCAHSNIWGGSSRRVSTAASSPDESSGVSAISTRLLQKRCMRWKASTKDGPCRSSSFEIP